MGIFKKLFGMGGGGQPPQKRDTPHQSPELDQLIREAQRLVRNGSVLCEDGDGQPSAYWHDVEPGELCISMKHHGAWLNVYLDEEDGGRVEATDTPIKSATPLYAEPYTYLPHIDVIFRRGSAEVGAFIERQGWTRDDPYNDNFPHPAGAAYERRWQQNCPLYRGEHDVIVGGWPMPWPDDEGPGLIEHELILWTLRNSEPWVEVFHINGNYVVKQRIT